MGNHHSHSESDHCPRQEQKSGKVLFYLYRTWTVYVAEKWTRNRPSRKTTTESSGECESNYSLYSFCSCPQCQRDDGFSSGCDSDLFGSGRSSVTMAPNSEESSRIGQFSFADESINKEKQRPPIYNPEDYALSLKKWGRKPPNGGSAICLYSGQSPVMEAEGSRPQSGSFRDYRNPMLTSSGSEMTLRQFGTVAELLAKLKSDLRLAYPSFVQEFVSDPLDGVTLLLDLLRAVQLSQSSGGHHTTTSAGLPGKMHPSVQRRALLDELSCLQCLFVCCQRYPEAIRRLVASSASLFTLAVCIMSNVTRSRVLALRLLTACLGAAVAGGHSAVSEAMSTLRLRFGEPARFRFLVGMLQSAAGSQSELLVAGLQFLNALLASAGAPQRRLYIQAELEQAGLDASALRRGVIADAPVAEELLAELDRWDKNHFDIEHLTMRLRNAECDNDALRDRILLLERRVQILQEEKGILMSLEQCLKERCSELQEEVHSLQSDKSNTFISVSNGKKKADSPQEDEGISSSERSLSPDERNTSVYEMYSIAESETLPLKDASTQQPQEGAEGADEEETTIEEVMEEFRNIINEAESDVYKDEMVHKQFRSRKSGGGQLAAERQMRVEEPCFDEDEIVPHNIHPQPPRKARSLVHLFVPAEDFNYAGSKEFFFENETNCCSSDSDSLLSASKYQMPRIEQKGGHPAPGRPSVKRAESFRHAARAPLRRRGTSATAAPPKTKSLDRVAAADAEALARSASSVFVSQREQRIFLPRRGGGEHYFPRLQEKKSASFLVRRTNAGLYSGQMHGPSCDFGTNVPTSRSSSSGGGKVTDLPSGLY